MEWAFVVILVLGVPIVLAIWLIVRAINARERIETLTRRIETLELEIHLIKTRPESVKPTPEEQPAAPPIAAEETIQAPESEFGTETVIFRRTPLTPTPAPAPVALSGSVPAPPPGPATPPPIPPMPAPAPIKATYEIPAPNPLSKINWEQFMGVKMFAWVGGLALFLGVAFFVKYSFEKNLISPEMRVAFGFITGLGLLIGGVVTSRKDYVTLSNTLCATGVLVLYAVTFSCRAYYHFPFFELVPTFLLMALITATAFLLAVRLNALVVAILGMLGGFLTPYLLSTGQDNPFGLFGYIGILVAGVLLVALYRRWYFLAAMAAVGTVVMEAGWAEAFFERNRYFEGNQIFIPLTVLLGFVVMYLGACWWARKRDGAEESKDVKESLWWFWGSHLALAGVALIFTGWFLSYAPLAARPWLMFGFVILIDLSVTVLCALEGRTVNAHPIAGMAVFGLLALWTSRSLTNELLNAALSFYFIFAVLHAVIPAWLQRRHGAELLRKAGMAFPPLALLLVLIPIFQLPEVSFMVWPFVLLVDLVAIVLAVASATILPVAAVLLLTLCATGALIFKIPATLTGLSTSFFLLAAFATFFVAVGVWLARKFKPELFVKEVKGGGDILAPENLAAQLPAVSAVLPFLLLIMATLRLPLVNPSPVFGVALLLLVLLLGVTKLFSMDWMPAIGLVCVASLECAWHFNRFRPENPGQSLTWYLLFLGVFTVFPFVFARQFSGRIVPWATAAVAGTAQFFLIHRLMRASYPNDVMGLLPAAFALIPLGSLVAILKLVPATSPARMGQLAWYGGVGLFFITLIFPIQFEHQWITIGWALEGAALLWLFHRLPHPGLRLAGVGLLAIAFVRLGINPAVFGYHPRSDRPIFNWYLYAYGIVTVCLFAGAWLLAPPRDRVGRLKLPAILTGFGTWLAFLLVNIEIADFFSEPGSRFTFQFSGNFARDMTYSIAWAMFALGLLVVGIMRNQAGARYAGLGLLSVTLLKLFFHDLAQLGQLYRIGAFMAVAVIAMVASFAYQRFFLLTAKARAAETVKKE